MKNLQVVAGIIEYNGKILCMQRDKGKYEYVSLKWEFPGGKIEEGETKEQALKREIIEEMDLEIEIDSHFTDVYFEYPDFTMNMYCYLCRAKNDKFVLNVHKDFVWLEKKNLLELDWAPADIEVVKEILKKQN